MWRRGVQLKSGHSGKTEKVRSEGGATVTPFKEFTLTSTLLQKTKTMTFDEKQLALTIKWLAPPESSSSPSSSSSSSSRSKRKSKKSKKSKDVKRRVLGKSLVNLGELAKNGSDSETTCAAGSSKVTLRVHCDWLVYNGKRLIKSAGPGQGGGGKIEIGGVMYDGMQTERDMSDDDSLSDLSLSDMGSEQNDDSSYADSSMIGGGSSYDDDFGEQLEDPFGSDSGISPAIPQIVVDIVEFLQDHALDATGLFRISGQPEVIQLILSIYAAGYAVAPSEFVNLHSTAGALKKYLRDADPLVPFDQYERFLEVTAEHDSITTRVAALQKLLGTLPPENLAVLAYVCRFLATLALHKEMNKMDSSNIAVVFGPNLMRPRQECTDMNQAFAAMSKTKALVELCIDQADSIFRNVLTLPSRSELEAVTFDQFRKREEAQHRKTTKLGRMLKRTTSIRKLAQHAEPTVPVPCAFSLIVVSVVDVAHSIFEAAGDGGVMLKWYRGDGKKDRGSSPLIKLHAVATASLSSSAQPKSPRAASGSHLATSPSLSSASLSPNPSSSALHDSSNDGRFYTADFQAVTSTLRFQGETTQIGFQATLFRNRQGGFDPRPFTFKLCVASDTAGTQNVKTLGHANLELAEYPPETSQQLAILTLVMKDAKHAALRRPKIHLRVSSRGVIDDPRSASMGGIPSSPSSAASGKSSKKSRKGSKKSDDPSALKAEIEQLKARVASLEAELSAKTQQIQTKDLEMERMIEQMSKINALMADRE